MRSNDLTPAWRLSPTAIQRLHAAAVRAHPAEACGALLGRAATAEIERAVRLPNRAPDPLASYCIPAAAVRRVAAAAARTGLELVGFFHSHPDGSAHPSRRDLRDAWPGYLYVIVPAAAGSAAPTAWLLGDDRAAFHAVRWQPAAACA